MEEELKQRLDKAYFKTQTFNEYPTHMIEVTIATLEAIRAHVIERYPDRFGDSSMLEDAIEVVKDYQ